MWDMKSTQSDLYYDEELFYQVEDNPPTYSSGPVGSGWSGGAIVLHSIVVEQERDVSDQSVLFDWRGVGMSVTARVGAHADAIKAFLEIWPCCKSIPWPWTVLVSAVSSSSDASSCRLDD